MRKFIITITAAIVFLFCSAAFASAETMMLEYDGGTHEYNGEVYALVVNNQLIDAALSPIIFNDRALVPVREIFEEVGATVNYVLDSQTVEVISDDYLITMRINDNVAYINGVKTNIPDNVVPKLIARVGGQTKTMVPVRFISETIGLDVEFDSEDGAILIDSDDYALSDEYQEPWVDEIVSTPQPVVPNVIDVAYDVIDDYNVKVTVETDEDIPQFSDFTLNSPERVVVDLQGTQLGNINENLNINESGVSSVRMGHNDERARIVIDVNNLKSYSVNKTDYNTLEISISTYEKQTATPAPEPTKKPSLPASTAPNTTSQYNGKKLIVLDAGHGGSDPGAIGNLDGTEILEKNLTLDITKKVKSILEDAGYAVSMTRTGDTLPSLVERPTQANEENAAVFVSIHINSVDNAPDANGTEVFYAESNNGDEYGTSSEQLAKNILSRMLYYMGSTNRGVKTAEHAVTKRCNMPAALAEVGFITNPVEVYNMTTDEYQQKAAQGIAEGIMITLKNVTVPN